MSVLPARFSEPLSPITKTTGSFIEEPTPDRPKSEIRVESSIMAHRLKSVTYRSEFSAPGKPSISQRYLFRDEMV